MEPQSTLLPLESGIRAPNWHFWFLSTLRFGVNSHTTQWLPAYLSVYHLSNENWWCPSLLVLKADAGWLGWGFSNFIYSDVWTCYPGAPRELTGTPSAMSNVCSATLCSLHFHTGPAPHFMKCTAGHQMRNGLSSFTRKKSPLEKRGTWAQAVPCSKFLHCAKRWIF